MTTRTPKCRCLHCGQNSWSAATGINDLGRSPVAGRFDALYPVRRRDDVR